MLSQLRMPGSLHACRNGVWNIMKGAAGIEEVAGNKRHRKLAELGKGKLWLLQKPHFLSCR